MGRLTEAQRMALSLFAERQARHPYALFPKGKTRDALRRLGLIERWQPVLKATGRNKPWRITDAGRAVLQEGEG